MKDNLVIYYSYNLNWNLPETIQNEAKAFLCQIPNELLPLIFQKYSKECWENAVDVVISIGYPNNKVALPKLYELFKDLNWPGASKALDYIKSLERHVNSIYIENACAKAVEENDTEWLYFLYEVSVQLHINKDDFKDINLYHGMKNAYEEA
ncbi:MULTISPECIES: hypothetical protein [unclassified Lysinibacillus]|uniref:hypothetical protein n=1 Tax=unclassified Lysinibacillus TaxID=2636778 RepID=UPI00232AFD69|nr:hypothetical protein [Lysinibacillus sp. OF-1]WCH47220.1 hypothetical protein NV349_19710 [Lysinibacillus sp. OF-1]